MTLTTDRNDEWGPMRRVAERQLAQRPSDSQRGTKWIVKRVIVRQVPVLGKRGQVKEGYAETQVRSVLVGVVYADNKQDALEEAKKQWLPDNLVVQSAISAQLTREELAAVERLAHRRTNHKGRRKR